MTAHEHGPWCVSDCPIKQAARGPVDPTAEVARLRARIAELEAALALARRDLAEANAVLATARHRGDTT